MEETTKAESLIHQIKPPRPEDAGLEDCALLPESIEEAFLKAASAVRSRVYESDDEDESGDPLGDSSDAPPEITPPVAATSRGGSAEKSGGFTGVSADEVSSGDGDAEEKADCLDGLQGLEIGEKDRGNLGKTVRSLE